MREILFQEESEKRENSFQILCTVVPYSRSYEFSLLRKMSGLKGNKPIKQFLKAETKISWAILMEPLSVPSEH